MEAPVNKTPFRSFREERFPNVTPASQKQDLLNSSFMSIDDEGSDSDDDANRENNPYQSNVNGVDVQPALKRKPIGSAGRSSSATRQSKRRRTGSVVQQAEEDRKRQKFAFGSMSPPAAARDPPPSSRRRTASKRTSAFRAKRTPKHPAATPTVASHKRKASDGLDPVPQKLVFSMGTTDKPPSKTPKTARKSSRKQRRRVSFGPQASLEQTKDAEQRKQKGNMFFAKQQYPQAIDQYSAAILLDPNNPTFLGNRAAAYLMVENYDDAIKDCEMAIRLQPVYPKVQMRASRAYLAIGRSDKAMEQLHKVIKNCEMFCATVEQQRSVRAEASEMIRNVKTYDKLVAEGDNHLVRENPQQTLKCAEDAFTLAPASKRVEVMRIAAKLVAIGTQSTTSEELMHFAKEASAHLQALNLDREASSVLYNYGLIVLQCALVVEAKVFFTVILGINPHHRMAEGKLALARKMEELLKLGTVAYSKRNCEEAIGYFDQALGLDKGNLAYNCRMHYRKAAAHLTMHLYKEAVLDCNRALELIPTYYKAKNQRAKALEALGRYREALDDLEGVYAQTKAKELLASIKVVKEKLNGQATGKLPRSFSTASSGRSGFQGTGRPANKASSSSSFNGNPMPNRSSGFFSKPFQRSYSSSNASQQQQRKATSPPRHNHRYNTRSSSKKARDSSSRLTPGSETLYEVLGVGTRATESQIKLAFKKLALKFHPDKNKSPSAEGRFKEISEAYSTLCSPAKRRKYDQKKLHRQPVF